MRFLAGLDGLDSLRRDRRAVGNRELRQADAGRSQVRNIREPRQLSDLRLGEIPASTSGAFTDASCAAF